MKREKINVVGEASYLLEQLRKGVLLTVAAEGKANTMTIGWGGLDIEWNQLVFTAYVRESRYTHQLLEKADSFTVNYPLAGQDVSKILAFCGSRSGRDVDKFEVCGLTPVESLDVASPAIAQLPLTLECEIVYRQDQDLNNLDPVLRQKQYPNGDAHTVYYGRIVNAYVLKED